MAFLESRLSVAISVGATGGPEFATDVVTVRSGYESRNATWSQARHRYEIGLTVRRKSEFDLIRDHFMAVRGRLDGFRFKDFADFQVTAALGDPIPLHGSTQVGTAGAGYGVRNYQLAKLYNVGANSYLRDIRKPVSGTLIVRRGGVVQAGYTPDYTTGIIAFTADQTKPISTHTVGAGHVFDVTNAFSPNFAIGGRVYVTNIAGTAADTLNDLSHEITNVAGTVITTSTVTTGMTATGGNAFYFAQPAEQLDFSCEFDVPVRFDVDQFNAVIVDKAKGGELLLELPSVPLIEIRV